jgi:hypothetical protein
LIPSDVSLFRHGAHPVSTEIHFFWGYTLQSLSAKRSRQQKSTGKGEKIQSFSKWAFVQFLFLLVSFPSDTGHAPSLRNTTFVQKCNFLGLPAHRKTFVDGTFKKNLPMNVPKHLLKHVPLPYLCSVKQKKTAMIKYIVRNKKNPKDKTKSASTYSSHPAPPWRPPSKSSTTPTSNSSSLRWRERLQANRRDAACRVSPTKINRHGGIQSLGNLAFAQFLVPFWCLSLPTRGTPRLYEIHFFGRRNVDAFDFYGDRKENTKNAYFLPKNYRY